MWSRGNRRCVLRMPVGKDDHCYRLEIEEGGAVVRSSAIVTSDRAWLMAKLWAAEDVATPPTETTE